MTLARARYVAVAPFVGPTTMTAFGPAAAVAAGPPSNPVSAIPDAATTRTRTRRVGRTNTWPPVSRTPHARGDDGLAPSSACCGHRRDGVREPTVAKWGRTCPVRWSGGRPTRFGRLLTSRHEEATSR